MVVQFCARFSEIREKPWLLDHRNLSSKYLRPSQTTFHLVGLYGFNNIVRGLLSNAQDIDLDQRDHRGRTPLRYAAECGHTEVVKTLLSDGRVDPDRQGKSGRTPLNYAAQNVHNEIFKTLFSDGRVDPDRQASTVKLRCVTLHGLTRTSLLEHSYPIAELGQWKSRD